jgi:maltose-binding protein MalE
MRLRSPQMSALLVIVALGLSVLVVATPKAKVIPARAAGAPNTADQIEFTKIVPANPSMSPYWAPATGDGSN